MINIITGFFYILLMPFALLATKNFKHYLAFQSFYYELTKVYSKNVLCALS